MNENTADTPAHLSLDPYVPAESVRFNSAVPRYTLRCTNGSATVGELVWTDGVLRFKGEADEAAKVFLACIARHSGSPITFVGPAKLADPSPTIKYLDYPTPEETGKFTDEWKTEYVDNEWRHTASAKDLGLKGNPNDSGIPALCFKGLSRWRRTATGWWATYSKDAYFITE